MPGRSLSKRFTSSISCQNMILLVCCFLLLAILLCFPGTALPLIRESILIWYQSLLPTLFPAMILSNIILYIFLNIKKYRFRIPFLSSVYHLDSYGCLVLLLGFLCGFPIGAYLCAKLVKEQRLSHWQGQYLLGFCNNLSPVFLVSIYCQLFPVLPKIPVLLLFYGIPLIYGDILSQWSIRSRAKKDINDTTVTHPQLPPGDLSGRSITEMIDYGITDALSSIVRLAGYIIFFRLLLLPLRLLEFDQTYSLILGNLIEITSGIQTYSQDVGASNIYDILVHTLPFMTFGGICCIGQTICMIRDSGLSILVYVRDKILQSILLIIILRLSLPFFG
ncbi:MAG: hypothetical protein K2K20_06775 [Lachnospiraceae bacterium]|nr:hypothetical protein [Lachnospiraceae bacterium]